MKSKTLFITFGMQLCISATISAQKTFYPEPGSNNRIPMGHLTSPVLNQRGAITLKNFNNGKALPYSSFDTASKQFIMHMPGQNGVPTHSTGRSNNRFVNQTANNQRNATPHFHLTKDINTTLTGSLPPNNTPNTVVAFAVLKDVSYFSADDEIHGGELWRSDGTGAGTYMVKDINPGEPGSDVSGIVAANDLLYFTAVNQKNGPEAWVSDGTESGTHLIMDIAPGTESSNPNQFVNVNGSVFFVTSSPLFWYNSQLWKTDGIEGGTSLVTDLSQNSIGYAIYQLTAVNNMVYFTATIGSGPQLFRSDGTDGGTYVVKEIGFNNFDADAPTQLTAYNNKLYFSGNDGTGRRLWVSDGTHDGTGYAPGFNDVFLQPDYVHDYLNTPFPILNDILYLSALQMEVAYTNMMLLTAMNCIG